MESSQKIIIGLLAVVALLGATNLGITTLGVTSSVDQPEPVSDIAVRQTDSTSHTSDQAAASDVKNLEISGKNITGESFALTVPDKVVVIPQGNGVRLQSYDQSLDQIPAGGFFMYITQGARDDGNMATSYATTTNLDYLGKEAVRGDGCGVFSGPCNKFGRGYYFARDGIMVSLFANDVAGQNAAEQVIKGIIWKQVGAMQQYADDTVSFSYPTGWHFLKQTNIPTGNFFRAKTYFDDKPVTLPEGESFFPVVLYHYPTDTHVPDSDWLFGDIRTNGKLVDEKNRVYYLSGISEMGEIPFEAYLHIGEKGTVIVYALTGNFSDKTKWEDGWKTIESSLQWK